ncbi:hypothetical protein TorRG33x02_012760 [Trema orientale]|uniref:Uncharacterized protein n=1 Tax=Trema orientale TaxID=63057 RepID=A0A2P5FZK5_TREOI|nr:hypothetical protein TorRG33x02_012760 [Trema orientale]
MDDEVSNHIVLDGAIDESNYEEREDMDEKNSCILDQTDNFKLKWKKVGKQCGIKVEGYMENIFIDEEILVHKSDIENDISDDSMDSLDSKELILECAFDMIGTNL